MKNAIIRISQLLFLSLLVAGSGWMPARAQNRLRPNAQLASKQLNARVEALLRKMTLEEKIGQLVQNSARYAAGPGASNLRDDGTVAKGEIGAMLLVGVEATSHYQHIAMEKSRLHIPLIFATEVLHGYRTTFPVPLALAASWDPAAIETVAHTSASEARADGIVWAFAPNLVLARDPRWGRIVESPRVKIPTLASAMARAWVEGFSAGRPIEA